MSLKLRKKRVSAISAHLGLLARERVKEEGVRKGGVLGDEIAWGIGTYGGETIGFAPIGSSPSGSRNKFSLTIICSKQSSLHRQSFFQPKESPQNVRFCRIDRYKFAGDID